MLKPPSCYCVRKFSKPFFSRKSNIFYFNKYFVFLLRMRKSNLVFNPNFISGLTSLISLNSSIKLFCKACSTILFDACVFIPTFVLLSSIISKVNFSLRLGLSDLLTQTLLPFSKDQTLNLY